MAAPLVAAMSAKQALFAGVMATGTIAVAVVDNLTSGGVEIVLSGSIFFVACAAALRMVRSAYGEANERYRKTVDELDERLAEERAVWAAERAELLAEIARLRSS